MNEIAKAKLADFLDKKVGNKEIVIADLIEKVYEFATPEVMVLLFEKLAIGLGINDELCEPDEPKEHPEPNFATAWDDAAIESIVNKCHKCILADFDFSRINHDCISCGFRDTNPLENILVVEIRMLVKGVLRVDPVAPCSILNRFEQSVIRSIAAAHRDYDHWNDK